MGSTWISEHISVACSVKFGGQINSDSLVLASNRETTLHCRAQCLKLAVDVSLTLFWNFKSHTMVTIHTPWVAAPLSSKTFANPSRGDKSDTQNEQSSKHSRSCRMLSLVVCSYDYDRQLFSVEAQLHYHCTKNSPMRKGSDLVSNQDLRHRLCQHIMICSKNIL